MANTPLPESQYERWLKYGVNVGFAVVIVVALAVGLIYIAQTTKKRIDTTSQRVYSLKEQTRNILKNLNQPIKLVSLYTRAGTNKADQKTDFVSPVEDLLDEYKRNSSKVDIELIDPVENPTKVDDLIHAVTEKYGGEVKKYKDFLDAYPARYNQIDALAKAEAAKVQKLPLDQIKTQDLANTIIITISTVQGFPQVLEQGKQQIERRLKQKVPDYKGATDSINEGMTNMSEMLGRVIDDFKASKTDDKMPAAIKQYMAQSLPNYEAMKKVVDGVVADTGKLGELKLDSLRQSLGKPDSILVMGENDIKVVPFDKVWQGDIDRKAGPDQELVKPKFAGEQQISSAILSLTTKQKPKVAFLRPGGPPVTESNPYQRGGAFSMVANRLRDYNFTILEKDYTGMYAMQAQMQGQPAAPEASDEDIKDAVWIVLDIPAPSQMGMPPPSIAAKLTEHLANGGSAMVLAMPEADTLATALGPWGVELRTNLLAVKPAVTSTNDRQGDFIQQAQRLQYVFIINQFGDHLITRPLSSLDAAIVPVIPIVTTSKDGYKSSPIVPLPTSPATWGSSSGQSAMATNSEVKFDASKGDMPGPIFAGSAVEKTGGGRLVTLGSLVFATDQLVGLPDDELAKQGYQGVPRFPGNEQLFLNSCFWLAKMDPMIAISPSAVQVSRIAPMTEGQTKAWNVGFLLLGLPGLVVLAGIGMYFSRRD